MHSLALDLKSALRGLARAPGFALVTVATLGLGIGANTAIFSVVYDVLLKPLPFEAPERLVTLWELSPDDAGRLRRYRPTAGNYRDWRDESASFASMALFGAAGFNWTGEGEPEELLGSRVTASYFQVLGIEPVLGRTFLPEENAPGNERAVILSHGLWQRRFGGASDVLGRTLTLDGAPYEVVGVLPAAVYPTWPQATGRIPFLPLYQQIWVPMALTEERLSNRRTHVFGVVARIRPEASVASAQSEMDTLARRLELAYPEANAGEGVLVVPYMDEVVGGARQALWLLLGTVGLLLATACANVAGLLLARAASRRRELAMRAALGAGARELARTFLAESLLLGLAGGVLGVVLAHFGIALLTALSPEEVPRLAESALSAPALAFAFLLALAASLVLGVAPALGARRPDLRRAVAEGARSMERGGTWSGRRLLVVSEVALAVVIVASAGLLLRSFERLRAVDLGFRADGVLVAGLTLPPSSYRDSGDIARFHAALLERLRGLPGVTTAALTYDHPLESNWIDGFRIVGSTETQASLGAALRIASPDYFRTLGIDVVRGRPFAALDDVDHPGVALVNEAFSDRYFEGRDPVGERLYTSTPRGMWDDTFADTFEIVGVVENVRFLGPAAPPEPAFYLPAAQFPQWEMLVVARAETDPEALGPRLREEVWALDGDLPLSSVTTMERLVDEAVAQPRFVATVLSIFATGALLLAALGLYGLLSYGVVQRTGEIGVRMALGARASDVIGMVVAQGLKLTAVGLGVGLPLALGASRLLASQLFGISAADLPTLAAVVVVLALVAALASYLPAYRASRIDPLGALRRE